MQILAGLDFSWLLLSWLLALAVLVHGQLQSGFISIDCGSPKDHSFTDDVTGISYSSDDQFISTGVNVNIDNSFMYDGIPQPLSDVRSFPQGSRNCYNLTLSGTIGRKFLIRALFLYGNYDRKNQVPQFDLYLGVNLWYSVKFSNASHFVSTEIINLAESSSIYVCLINIGLGTPFISGLELRPLNASVYNTDSGSLLLFERLDVGVMTGNQSIRDRDDVYDRIWSPYTSPNWISLNTSSVVDGSGDGYRAPPMVMKTAVRPANGNGSLELYWNPTDSTLQYYIFMYFAELEKLQSNQSRKLSISINGSPLLGSFVPRYLYTTTISNSSSLSRNELRVSIFKTTDSTLPPILNAIEVYVVKQFPESPTYRGDVDAIMSIRWTYRVDKNWVGDPCGPRNYSWEGLNCSYSGSDSPRIIALNLSSSGLTGEIIASIASLTSIQSLDLSNNSLSGQVPDFLSQLTSLRFLNLKGNQLTGYVPDILIERSNDGSLTLSVDSHNICASGSCKKGKNIVIPLVASVTSALVLLIILIILWRLKSTRQPAIESGVLSNREGSFLASKSQQFTYAEIVNITNNFQKAIGKGGFGTVYHGYLKDGSQVAVKMLSQSSSQGSKEFRTEAELLMRVHHRNLASFIGYCDEGGNMALIYEYMAKGNLKEYLSDTNANVLSWERRLQIAIDAAQGLEYLHSGCKPPIIHRDVKTANILLSEALEAKIADFGLSKVFPNDGFSHVLTQVMGTPGYLDPEYYVSSKLNEKSDVFSFGIVLLELITGQPPIIKSSESVHIIQWVGNMLERGEIRNIVDPRLQGDFDINSIWKATEIAIACTPSTSIRRPTMNYVLTELKDCLAIEAARDRSSVLKEDHGITLVNSTEMFLVDHGSITGPVPR
ncbi:PREDICTED: probable LRR receptor-like serine/threonine-protein kinase At4g29180 [Nelumbo nucifera]|uniref:non-specific serine/threonine protein kinase n=2 Tax=Nelumbo nucifera TaxID=4432 RepID=A0A822ZLX8_NELNU|nr:PREDICTED: probable LRR receptor-like serine/threonine-protein kinase At4g29180 [Nelumbo nucifera]DAD44521.1 TPA_asm: hypothetical protein HUJ06_002751 [Nelumbo nucifera]